MQNTFLVYFIEFICVNKQSACTIVTYQVIGRHDTLHNDIQHYETQNNGLICNTQHNTIESHYAECLKAESRNCYYYTESHHAECNYAECRYAQCRYAECCYAGCRGTDHCDVFNTGKLSFRGPALSNFYCISFYHGFVRWCVCTQRHPLLSQFNICQLASSWPCLQMLNQGGCGLQIQSTPLYGHCVVKSYVIQAPLFIPVSQKALARILINITSFLSKEVN